MVVWGLLPLAKGVDVGSGERSGRNNKLDQDTQDLEYPMELTSVARENIFQFVT